MLKKICNIIINILTILMIFLILFVGYYLIQTKVMNKKYANICGYTFFEVITGSMSNTINVGDVIILKINSDYQENDIIVYESNQNYITHRVIEINENGVVTKGDSNNVQDEVINQEQVLGKVIKILPNVAKIKNIVTPTVIVSIILIIMICIILNVIKKVE